MSDESSLPIQSSVTPLWIHLNLHSELFGKKGTEEEIVVSLKILDSNSFSIEALELMEDGKIIRESGRLIGWKKFFEPKKEFEQIAKNYQMVNLLFLKIEESGKDLHRLRVSSSEMRIRNKNPILSGPSQTSPSPSHATVVKAQTPHLIRVVDISQVDENRTF